MTSIGVPGSGCVSCQKPGSDAREALGQAGVEAEVVKVTDHAQIAARVLMNTPGLVIDGEARSVGRIRAPGDIAEWLVAVS